MLVPEIVKVHRCQSCLQKCIPMTDGDEYKLPDGTVKNLIVCFDCHRIGEKAYLLASARSEASEQGWASVSWSEARPRQRVFRFGQVAGHLIVNGPFTITRKYVLHNRTDFTEHGEVLLNGE